nr:immunoglobulin heavy chain junction region [Mus musculus]MBK4188082.1 immunoglobulin heavy chain junction region [Mus musculus]
CAKNAHYSDPYFVDYW